MKHLKKFNESISHLKGMSIISLCKKYEIKDYKVNWDDGSIDVYDDLVDIPNIIRRIVGPKSKITLDKIPLKFNRVNGNFKFSSSELKNLENSPRYIAKTFDCANNELTTLLGGPDYVGGDYICYYNNLKDIYGLPESFNGKLQILNDSPHGYANISASINRMDQDNPVHEILDVIKYKKVDNGMVRFAHLLNYNKVIRNGDTIVQDRLEEALYGLGFNIHEVKWLLLTRGAIGHSTPQERFRNYKII